MSIGRGWSSEVHVKRGELYKAILEERPAENHCGTCGLYDYYEIQPIGNNRFMIGSSKVKNVNSEEDLQEINRKIVELGEQFQKSRFVVNV